MAFHLYENVWETTTTTGTGNLTLSGAVPGWRSFGSQYANGDTMFYSLYDGLNFEHGFGTYATSGNLLSRTSVARSTNANALVNWGVGTKQVVAAPPGIALESLLSADTFASTGYVRGVNYVSSAVTFAYDLPGQMLAEPAAGTAGAGRVGEIITANVAVGSAVALTSAAGADVTTISVTAGDWDIEGILGFTGTGTTTLYEGWLSNLGAGVRPVLPSTTPSKFSLAGSGVSVAQFTQASTGVGRYSLSGTTSVRLGASATFSAGTTSAYGIITARRAR